MEDRQKEADIKERLDAKEQRECPWKVPSTRVKCSKRTSSTSKTRDHRSHMNQMMSDPFAGFRGAGMAHPGMAHPGMLEDGRRNRGGERRGGGGGSQALAPFDENFGFGSFGNIFDDMHRNMNTMMQQGQTGRFDHREDSGHGAMYQQTSVMSYSNNAGGGPPKVFQASQSTRTGPGGVRETRKAVRDSERQLEKMAVGHHIRDRGHEVERHKNTRTGQMDEMNNYHNMDEADSEAFDREWQDKTRQAFQGLERGGDRRRDYRGRDERPPRAVPSSRQPALPPPETGGSEHWGQSGSGSRRHNRS